MTTPRIGMVIAAAAVLALPGCAMRPSLEHFPKLHVTGREATGLQVRFLGTGSLIFSDGEESIVIDGFVSRPGLWSLATSRLESDPGAVQTHVTDALRGDLSAVFVAHTHFDHALDALTVAKPPARLLGSTDLLAAAAGTRAVEVLDPSGERGGEIALRRFRVTPFRTGHSARDLAPGRITWSMRRPAHALAWKGGDNFSFLVVHGDCRILVVTSAGEPEGVFADVRADIVMLSIGRLGITDEDRMGRYWRGAVVPTGARLVVPIHWDDPTRGLEHALVATPYLADQVDEALDALTRLAGDDVKIRLPMTGGPLDFPADLAPRCRPDAGSPASPILGLDGMIP